MTAETPKIHSQPFTLAPDTQLDRWRALLRSAVGQLPLPALAAAPGYRGAILLSVQAVAGRAPPVDLPRLIIPPLPAVAPKGAAVSAAIWSTFARSVAGDDAASEALRQAIDELSPTALATTIDDNPEPWWQQEMLILHALHSFALRQNDGSLIDKTLDCAAFHLAEIQPDHATNEPWAVHAYASHADGAITAETLLHAAHMNGGGSLNAASRWIAADALAALEAFAGA